MTHSSHPLRAASLSEELAQELALQLAQRVKTLLELEVQLHGLSATLCC